MPVEQAGIRREAAMKPGSDGWSVERSKERRRPMAMSERKNPLQRDELNGSPKEIRDRLEQTETEIARKLETLDAMFSQTKENPEEFHSLYIKPLLDAELSLETSLELLVAGVLRPN
jgi:hypothetical protein